MRKHLVALALVAFALAAHAQTYQHVQLDDLKLDIKKMVGKHVSTQAMIQTMGEMNFLKSDPMDMTPVWAATDDLPREDRKKLVSGCQMILCSGTFYGTVRNLPLGPGLRIERVEWH